VGSLQDNLTYPNRLEEQMSMEALRAVLTEVNLEHLADRKDDLLMQADRNEVTELSLGEKQQLGIARVLLNDPAFAVLDEATSAIDPAVFEYTKTNRDCNGTKCGKTLPLFCNGKPSIVLWW
jgi:vitamin B12/bleomycin/antimicrobial peptide transport system ATP-binding/permease protein